MTLPASGAMKLGAYVNVELGFAATAKISLGSTAVRTLYGISTGAIKLAANGYGKSSRPPFIITPSVTSVNEGSSVTFTIATVGFGSGTLYWTTVSTTTALDFTDALNSGAITITNNAGTFSKTLTNDQLSEGTEYVVMQLRTGSITGPIVATSAAVTVNDTSRTIVTMSPATYNWTARVSTSGGTLSPTGYVNFYFVVSSGTMNITGATWTGTASGSFNFAGLTGGPSVVPTVSAPAVISGSGFYVSLQSYYATTAGTVTETLTFSAVDPIYATTTTLVVNFSVTSARNVVTLAPSGTAGVSFPWTVSYGPPSGSYYTTDNVGNTSATVALDAAGYNANSFIPGVAGTYTYTFHFSDGYSSAYTETWATNPTVALSSYNAPVATSISFSVTYGPPSGSYYVTDSIGNTSGTYILDATGYNLSSFIPGLAGTYTYTFHISDGKTVAVVATWY